MDFSILFVFVTWTTSMSYSTYGKGELKVIFDPYGHLYTCNLISYAYFVLFG